MMQKHEKTTGQKRQTVYMPPGVHRQVRIMAAQNDTTQQSLFREAMNDLFRKHGVESWESLEGDAAENSCQASAE